MAAWQTRLIDDRGFAGAQITETWNLSDGCGGNA
jgi:hypothetical protein